MNAPDFIEQLRRDNEAFYGDDRGRGALKDLQVVFPVSWIYLAELVQNAIDAGATRIRFAPEDSGELLFEHNGKPFTSEDVRALCLRGVSTKSTNTVGFMGVGFKSVFKAYETVVVSSAEWKFRLSVPSDEMFGSRVWVGAVLPRWDPNADKPSEWYTCRFQFIRRLGDGEPDGDLAELLREGEALLPLLGWNGVTDFAVGNKEWRLSTTETPTDGGDASRVKVAASSPDGSVRSWMLFLKSYQPSEPAVLRFLRHRQIQPTPEERETVLSKAKRIRDVSLFCELSPDGSPQPVSRGQCFSLVPTGHTTCLGLHMQADWLLDISRREPMRIANDPWQEEILAQVPHLIRSYLDWLVSDETDGAQSWDDGYNALPGASEDTEIDVALHGGDWGDSLRASLAECRFIPFEAADGTIDFATPRYARALPEPLQRVVSGDYPVPADIFGPQIVAASVLGDRALTFLKATHLLETLGPAELETQWKSDTLKNWYKQKDDTLNPAYVRLIGGLAGLDSHTTWADADLDCLPAADGVWRSRRALKRYPPNWSILGPSPRTAATLESFVGTRDELLDWKTDQGLRRDPAAQLYLQSLSEQTLEEVVTNWWATLGENIDQTVRELVVEFTELVRRQKTLPRLVSKVLAISNDGERLLPIDEVLLADPYAGDYRRVLFPGLPTVSSIYLASSRDATDAEWQTFFEEQDPGPHGRPMLMLDQHSATPSELNLLTHLPALRYTYGKGEWHGVSIDSKTHYVIEAEWPEAFEPAAGNAPHSLALQRSMLEMTGILQSWRQPYLAYIPPKSSTVSTQPLPADAPWFTALRDHPWIFDQSGKGPYLPADILDASDATRPDVPVARLVDGFAALAVQLGLAFGRSIPNAPAIERLRTFGGAASWSELHNLLQEAITEAEESPERLALLRSVLNTTALFELPHGRTTPDGLRRVTGSRVVDGSRRSTLSDFVCSIDSFEADGVEQTVLGQISSVVAVPDTTTAEHAAAFLRWVWSTTPEADAVRQVLPRAFQYVLDLPEEEKRELRTEAKVFVTARRWVRVADGNVFLNDLEIADKDLLTADQGVALATPGHLGEDDEAREEVCAFLDLPLASTRYSLRIEDNVGSSVTPSAWRSEFGRVQEAFERRINGTDDNLDPIALSFEDLELVSVDTVTTRLLKDGVELYARASSVAIRDGRAHVVGQPHEFASELAQALIEHWGLTLRHDGYAIGARLAGWLARLDMPIVESESDAGNGPTVVTPSDVTPVGPSGSTPPLAPRSPTSEPEHKEGGGTPSHTAKQKDSQHEWLRKKLQETKRDLKRLEQQVAEGLGAEVVSLGETPPDEDPPKAFGDDKKYRDAVVKYEARNERFPQAAESGQAGFDIDSYSHDVGHPERALARRIEVKGKGAVWNGDEIVELSDRQLKDALARRLDHDERVAADFDYWLYVVETGANGLRILPIRNPARRAAKFEFRGGVWRAEVEGDSFEEEIGD